ncbi:Kinesin-related protein 13 [Rhynchospora pubera]|uniref:Kinesin-like protein KIN-10A n=1 Tax=Rhynchospora pubera TaxID=906938 RepID=A0AAV8E551_9POAL|nr:Kinesin-related protein 13 [Rhynchospora pubera]
MAPTPKPTPNPNQTYHTPSRTPNPRQRLQFPTPKAGCGTHNLSSVPTEHPVEVIGRIRDHPDSKERNHNPLIEIPPDGQSIKVRTDIGYRDFTLDGVSVSENENLEVFYNKFVKSRVEGVRVGSKCTIMMYGPTGSGKSHTMFGCAREPGIVYRALKDILGDGTHEQGDPVGEEADETGFKLGIFVRVAVLEIYNEEIYDLLSANLNAGAGNGIAKGNSQKTRLEIIGKKAKNPTYLSGNEAGKISREVAKVEKRRIVRSTLCNERSSRSHCMIILDVPSVGGRLMLVDMAGSENIEAAGQTGFEAKMQTAKINQGNIALKRVVESIANGDSHVPFRDSKLTMLLQDSFLDDKSKILMILCASPDPREMHKTISTLEYGAKAKCIVRAAHPATPKPTSQSNAESVTLLASQIALMNQHICELQRDKQALLKERDQALKSLSLNEDELAVVRFEVKRMEEKVLRQDNEIESLKNRLREFECGGREVVSFGHVTSRLAEMVGDDQNMVKSMELDYSDQVSSGFVDVKEVKEDTSVASWACNLLPTIEEEASEARNLHLHLLPTIFEAEESEEVEKEVVQEERRDEMVPVTEADRQTRIENIFRLCGNYRELAKKDDNKGHIQKYGDENAEPSPLSAKSQLVAALAGSPIKVKSVSPLCPKEAKWGEMEGGLDVYVKWEVSKESSGSMITKLTVPKDSTLSRLRLVLEAHFNEKNNNQDFVFLLLKDPMGAPVAKEMEAEMQVTNLPKCSNKIDGYLASLRPLKNGVHRPIHLPLSPLENKLGSPLVST